MSKKILGTVTIILLVLVVPMATSNAQTLETKVKVEDDIILCTQEVRLCPDGSYVGRKAPSCEFATCPGEGGGADNGDSIIKDDESAEPVTAVVVEAGEVRGWDPEEKEVFLQTVKTHAELRSGQDLENFARGVLLEDENMEKLEIAEDGVKIGYHLPAKLFNIFETSFRTQVEIKSDSNVKVKFPWYSFLYKKYAVSEELEAELRASVELDDWMVLSEENVAQTAGIIIEAQGTLKKSFDTSQRLLRGR
ncbi:MAG: hypothetical protein COV96_00805 [Candidatus Zambryskibacteria bacterium CG11_big_fil_rev_8_21_14_0_20_42_18]|nr:MAG: hypothetical protein COV96_00805 [Candidatus Zambryskibacteria bacterium CG11_big_fil_rev_8_21_14_0_20_42_18]